MPDAASSAPRPWPRFAVSLGGWRRLARLTTAAVTAALLATSLLGLLFGDRWWLAELAANLPVQHIVAFTAVTVLASLLRRPLLIVGAAAGLLINVAVVTPGFVTAYLGEQPPAQPGTEHLDITFFNAKFAADPEATAHELSKREHDLVVVSLGSDDLISAIATADPGLVQRTGQGSDDSDEIELTVFVRPPVAEVDIHRLSDENRDVIVEVDLELNEQQVKVVVAHPVSPLTPRRAERRDRLLNWITAWAKDRDVPVVVVGDLNATIWSPSIRRLHAETDLLDSQIGFGLQASYPAVLGPFGIAIDHLLHSPEFTVLDRSLGPAFGSDHRMLHVRLAPAVSSMDSVRR